MILAIGDLFSPLKKPVEQRAFVFDTQIGHCVLIR
jgi:hypothetical protein